MRLIFLLALLQLLLTPAAVVAAIVWVSKSFLGQLLARDLEQYKQREQRETEQHKKLLEAVQFEQQTRFSWAYQKQADVIAAIYGKLAVAH